MASKEDRHVVGLVKKVPFNNPARKRELTVGNPLREFNQNTKNVIRFNGLSDPVLKPNQSTEELLVRKAFVAVQGILKKHAPLQGIPFTIIDGTSWMDSEAMVEFGLDILYINVYWDRETPVIAVMLGWQKAIKDSRIYRVNNGIEHPVIFEYDTRLADIDMFIRIGNACDRQPVSEISYDHAFIFMDALVTTFQGAIEYPVAAATYLDDVIWYVERPHRHFHIAQSTEVHAAQDLLRAKGVNPSILHGFLTNHGNFVSRKRGMYQALMHRTIIDTPEMMVAVSFSKEESHFAGLLQPEDMGYNGHRISEVSLFSEDLW